MIELTIENQEELERAKSNAETAKVKTATALETQRAALAQVEALYAKARDAYAAELTTGGISEKARRTVLETRDALDLARLNVEVLERNDLEAKAAVDAAVGTIERAQRDEATKIAADLARWLMPVHEIQAELHTTLARMRDVLFRVARDRKAFMDRYGASGDRNDGTLHELVKRENARLVRELGIDPDLHQRILSPFKYERTGGDELADGTSTIRVGAPIINLPKRTA